MNKILKFFRFTFRNIIRDEIGNPLGRFMCDVGSASLRNDGQQIITLTLTVRGPPRAPTLASAVELVMEPTIAPNAAA